MLHPCEGRGLWTKVPAFAGTQPGLQRFRASDNLNQFGRDRGLAAAVVLDGQLVDQLAGTVFGGASGIFWDTMFNYLVAGLQGLLIFGVVVAIAGWFAGRSRPAKNVRAHMVAGLTELGSNLPENGLSAFLRERADNVRWAITAVMVLILVVGDVMSLTRMIWVLLLAGGLFTLLQVLIGSKQTSAAPAEVTLP